MTAPSDAENQILLFNTILRLEEKIDRVEARIDRRFEQVDRRFDLIERQNEMMAGRIHRIEEGILEIREYLQRLAPRRIGFNPAQPPSEPQQQEAEEV